MIEVKNLVKRYGDHVAVNNLSFTVEEGQRNPVIISSRIKSALFR